MRTSDSFIRLLLNLRKLALNDERFVASVLGMGRNTVEVSQLDEKTHALVRLAASLAYYTAFALAPLEEPPAAEW